MERLRQVGSAMQRDFCPWANRWVYWIKNPFWSIVLAAVAAGVCAYGLNPWLWIPCGVLLLVALAGLALPLIAIRGVDLQLFFDVRRTEVGQPVVVRLDVKNRWWVPVWGLSVLRGLSVSADSDADDGVSLARVPARSEVEYMWEFVPGRRGAYPMAPVEVETGFPFGLIRASRPARVHGHLIVRPRTVSLQGLPPAAESCDEDELSPRRAGNFGDVIGTRAFREGDSLRRVHWAQSARQQMLIVTERQAPQSSTVRVAVDLSGEAHASVGEDTTECLISAAASICRSLHEQHCRVECSIGGRVFVAGAASHGYHALMDEFATCEVGRERGAAWPAGAFEIVVTTPNGDSAEARRVTVHQAGRVPPAGSWMTVGGWPGLTDELPEAWRSRCHVA